MVTAFGSEETWEADCLRRWTNLGRAFLRIAKFHLRDNTRGEPRDWKKDELKEWSLKVNGKGKVSGNFLINSSDGEMGYEGKIKGSISVDTGRLTKFDFLVLGKHWGIANTLKVLDLERPRWGRSFACRMERERVTGFLRKGFGGLRILESGNLGS